MEKPGVENSDSDSLVTFAHAHGTSTIPNGDMGTKEQQWAGLSSHTKSVLARRPCLPQRLEGE
jgi:hypothetical protein